MRHQCNLCCQRFNTEENLENHLKIHSGEKPFQCSTCLKQFIKLGLLQQHLSLVHGHSKTGLSCDDCNKVFKSRDKFLRHKGYHLSNAYCCDICIKKFKSDASVKHHKMTAHSVAGEAQSLTHIKPHKTKGGFKSQVDAVERKPAQARRVRRGKAVKHPLISRIKYLYQWQISHCQEMFFTCRQDRTIKYLGFYLKAILIITQCLLHFPLLLPLLCKFFVPTNLNGGGTIYSNGIFVQSILTDRYSS